MEHAPARLNSLRDLSHTPIRQIEKQDLPPEIANFPLVYRDIANDHIQRLFVIDISESEQIFILEIAPVDIAGVEENRIYLINKIGDQTPGYSKLVTRKAPDEWGMVGKPYVEWTMTDDDPAVRKNGLAELRAEAAQQSCVMYLNEPLYSGVELRSGAREMWEKLEGQGKAEIVAERPNGEKRYRRTLS